MVLGREVPPQQPDGGEGHRARGEGLEEDGKASAGSSRLDAIAGGVFGEAKHLRAVTEEGPEALGGVERRPGVERRQVRDELDRGLALTAGENADAREEIVIRETRRESESVHTHVACVSRGIWRAREGPGARQERRVEVVAARAIQPAGNDAKGRRRIPIAIVETTAQRILSRVRK